VFFSKAGRQCHRPQYSAHQEWLPDLNSTFRLIPFCTSHLGGPIIAFRPRRRRALIPISRRSGLSRVLRLDWRLLCCQKRSGKLRCASGSDRSEASVRNARSNAVAEIPSVPHKTGTR
jgi:hypothetical protein